jgi:excisionase family DNA binding protein
MDRLTISVPEAARRLGIGRNTAYEAARQGLLPAIRIGKRIVVPLAAFEAMLTVPSKQQMVVAEPRAPAPRRRDRPRRP